MCYQPKPIILYKTRLIDEKTGEVYNTRQIHFINTYDIMSKKINPEEIDWLPCGKCEECLCQLSSDWATRAMLESQKWPYNAFVTLTYDNEHLPKKRSLKKRDLQLFWKRLRKADYKIRYLACGEYGPNTRRPHYHAIIFNYWPEDCKPLTKSIHDDQLFTSKTLEKIWGKGYIVIGTVNYETCAYVARYVMKKAYGAPTDIQLWKKNQEPEFRCASRRPGLGYYSIDDEKLLRNFGVLCKTSYGTTLKPLPTYIRSKIRKKYRQMYFEKAVEHARAMKEEHARARKTDINFWEYKKNHDNARRKALKKLDKRQDFEL